MKNNVFRVVLAVVGVLVTIGLLLACSQPAAQPAPAPKAEAPKAAAPKAEATKPAAEQPKAAPTAGAKAEAPKAAAKAAPSKPAGTAIKIGFMQSYTGVLADFGKRNRIAADMALKEINAAGGINGVPISLVMDDVRTDEQEAIRVMQKFASDDKVLADVGPFESPGTTVAFPFAVKAKMPALTMSLFMPGIAETVRPYGFSFNLADAEMIPPMIKAYTKAYNPKKVAIVSQTDQAYVKGLGDELGAAFKAAGIEVVNIGNPIGVKGTDTDYSAAVTRLKGLQVDGVLLALTSRQAGPFVVEMRRQGVNIPPAGSTTLTESGYIVTGGKAVEGSISGSVFWEENPDPAQKKLAAAFSARAKTEHPDNPNLDSFTSITYDIFHILAKAMREGGIKNTPDSLAADREIIAKAVANLKDFPGTGGKLTMRPSGIVQREVFVLQVKDGKWDKIPQ
ncbi:MAG: ABC transporter substrate-binding protein [Chloroflexi bacterium]|nr:ABC transporter substrate-binding protein [Chloroflexota bacterium]